MDTRRSYEIKEESQFGGFWIRVMAAFIDFVVIFILMSFIIFLIGVESQAIVSVVSIIVWWVYFASMHSSSWQASVGKKVVNIKVADESGNRISFGRATGRHFATYISGLILGIGYMMAGWTKRKRSLHDMIAGTLVIKVEKSLTMQMHADG